MNGKNLMSCFQFSGFHYTMIVSNEDARRYLDDVKKKRKQRKNRKLKTSGSTAN